MGSVIAAFTVAAWATSATAAWTEARCDIHPAGILRMEDRQASIVVQSPQGEKFTINFMKYYVNATNRKVDAWLEGDAWTVTIDGGEVYEVPLAATEGG